LALPHLLKYVYTHGTDEVIRRGKKIHAIGFVELVEYDNLFGSAVFRVKDDSYSTFYKVYIQKINDPQHVSMRCACPYNLGDICRHEAASLFQLQEMLDKNLLKTGMSKYDQRHTVAKMKHIDLKTLRLLSSQTTYQDAEQYLRTSKANIESAKEETVKATVEIDGRSYKVIIKKNEERNFDTSSDYEDIDHPLNLPKMIVFLQLLNSHGPYYFDSIRNWDKEKNKLLEAYGYSLSDDLKGKFEFSYKDGKPFLRVLDTSIKRVNAPTTASVPKPVEVQEDVFTEALPKPETSIVTHRLGLVINFNKKNYPYFTIDAISGEADENADVFSSKVEKLDLSKYVEAENFNEEDRQMLNAIRKLQEPEISKYISRNSPFSGIWENIIHQEEDDLPEDTRALVREYLFPKLKKLFLSIAGKGLIFHLAKGKAFRTSNLHQINISSDDIKPSFDIIKNNGSIEIKATVKAGGLLLDLKDNEAGTPLFYLYNHQLFSWKDQHTSEVAENFFPAGTQKTNFSDWSNVLQQQVLPLTKEFKVNFDKSLLQEIKDGKPDISLYLAEKGDYLLFQPIFSYKGFATTAKERDEVVVPAGDKVIIVHRNRPAEQEFVAKMQNLHSNFIYQEDSQALALKGIDVLKNNWFFLFVDAMNEMKTPVFGFDALKNFRFNTARPSTKIFINSNTDWFDARIDIVFGDQQVSVAEVKRALANKQQFVQLGDGTLGILPEEWLKKYSLLFRVGEGKTNQLKLSRYHMSVIDELYENRDENELVLKLEEKYENLKEFNTIKEIDLPEQLQGVLRPYQVSGYHWLNYLSEVKWGGILADDMGLGKTVQALSFMQHYKNEHGKLQAMVVCPTTLIYNWENEIKKFTPKLSYCIHHGATRSRDKEKFANSDVIITTYGTLRSDIKLLVTIELDYLLLDESQAIKNPLSKVTRAASLLHAKNRLCMSGTPLQNNTFDIFAQMNFLNPGMLGSMEFFRQEFAIPIDKFGEPDRKEHLKKILYPLFFAVQKNRWPKIFRIKQKRSFIVRWKMSNEYL
jgi:non-specific serine/threonine protein kinase